MLQLDAQNSVLFLLKKIFFSVVIPVARRGLDANTLSATGLRGLTV